MAPQYANLILILEIGSGVALLVGAFLARRRRFRQHAWCQSMIVLLNLIVMVLVMIPSFRARVIPKIPLKLGKSYYALAPAHAALGTITEIAGLYILLVAGTSVLPEKAFQHPHVGERARQMLAFYQERQEQTGSKTTRKTAAAETFQELAYGM